MGGAGGVVGLVGLVGLGLAWFGLALSLAPVHLH